MYLAHFGLTKSLFDSGIAQDTAVFLGPKQELAVANCRIALTTLDSAVVITGAAGVGKTTLAATALRESSTRLALAWLNGAPANAHELLELLLAELGMNAARAGRVERLQMWRQFLNETNATDSRVFVVAERAEDMPAELLRALESLTAADPNGCRGANLVLLGQPSLTEHLKAQSLESLRQRIRLRQRLEPLTPAELRDYLAHHVARAGGALDKVFGADAIAALHQHSSGIPRVVNNLCETALTLAATRREQQLTGALIARVAVGLFGLDAAPEQAADAQPAPTASAESASAPAHSAAPPSAVSRPASAAAPPQATVPSVAAPPIATTPPVAATQPVFKSPVTAAAPASAAPTTPVAAPPPADAPRERPAQASTQASTANPAPVFTLPLASSEARAPQPSPVPARPAAAVAAAAGVSHAPTRRPLLMASTAPAPTPSTEYDGSQTDIADEILGETTLADEAEVVQMAEFPVLTDAVEDVPAARAEPARAEPPRAKPAAAAAPKSPPQQAVAGAKPAPAATPAKPRPAADDDEDVAKQTQTVRALAAAKSIDDISSSMAETLFGEADLDMLSAALASAGWPENESEQPAAAAPASTADEPAEPDAFDLFDLGPDAPLELIDDSSLPPQKRNRIKIANDR